MTELLQKMQIKPGKTGNIINLPDTLDLTEQIPAEYITGSNEDLDWLMAFVTNKDDIDRLADRLRGGIRDDSVIWICYPKQSSGIKTDINRDKGWEAIHALGLRGVRQISIDQTWSGLRFRFG